MSKPQQPEVHRSGHIPVDREHDKEVAEKKPIRSRPETKSGPQPVPPENRPGHHPEQEQDKPQGPPETARRQGHEQSSSDSGDEDEQEGEGSG